MEENAPTFNATQNREHGRDRDVEAPRFEPLVPTIFHEGWWLDAATGGDFTVAEVIAGGRTVGRLPFQVTSHLGLKIVRIPRLTYFLGPGIDEGEGNLNNRFLKRLDITRELIRKLPEAPWQYVKCHRGVTDVIAFQEQGFRTYVQFTHEIGIEQVETLWQQMRNKTRNVIRRAEEQLLVKDLTDPAEFVQIYARNLASRKLESEINLELCKGVIAASLERGRGRMVAACDKNNQIVAATFCVWDCTSSYYLLSTRSNDSGNGAISLLIWEAIKHAAHSGRIFDFAGLGSQGSVLLYSGFGGSIQPRYVPLRTHRLARIMSEAKLLFKAENYFY